MSTRAEFFRSFKVWIYETICKDYPRVGMLAYCSCSRPIQALGLLQRASLELAGVEIDRTTDPTRVKVVNDCALAGQTSKSAEHNGFMPGQSQCDNSQGTQPGIWPCQLCQCRRV